MATVIVNCFHWIGFHFTEILMERGEQVLGVHGKENDKNTFLSMFVSRNSLYSYEKNMPETAQKVIVIGYADIDTLPKSDTIIQCFYDNDAKIVNKKSHLEISMPLLYGEWMKMEMEGILAFDKYIPFTSKQFMNEAVYVRDFINHVLDLIDHRFTSPKQGTNDNKEFILENIARFRDNRNKEDMVEEIQKHFLQYKLFYYE